MRLEPGQTLGHYRIDRPIGQGGMGEVFLAARDPNLGSIKMNPYLQPVRSDPRLNALRRRIGLPTEGENSS